MAGLSAPALAAKGYASNGLSTIKLIAIFLLCICGICGLSTNSWAVNIGSDGQGQVLIYPYYTTRDGQSSQFTVNNNSESVKAIKVRIHEGKASQLVLVFNLYLGPHDSWTASIIDNGIGATIASSDLSCTAPMLPGTSQSFESDNYVGDSALHDSLDRTREGYVELIEMAVVTGAHAAAATQIDGVPDDCPALVTSWTIGGAWLASSGTTDTTPVTDAGTISGRMIIADAIRGVASTYDAVAFASFNNIDNLHSAPSSESTPSLDNAVPQSVVFENNALLTSSWSTDSNANGVSGGDAVSALIMQENLYLRWSTLADADLQTRTDLVVAFPTKQLYVPSDGLPSAQPFSSSLAARGACEGIGMRVYDQQGLPRGGDINFFPPQVELSVPSLCWGTNILTFDSSDIFRTELGENVNTSPVAAVGSGSMELKFDFDDSGFGTSEHPTLISDEGDQYIGLPLIQLVFRQVADNGQSELRFGSFSFPTIAMPGDTVGGSYIILNTGGSDSTTTDIAFRLSSDNECSVSDLLLQSSPLAVIAAMGRVSGNPMISIPQSTLAGDYLICATIDATNNVPESNEGNNEFWARITVTNSLFGDGFE